MTPHFSSNRALFARKSSPYRPRRDELAERPLAEVMDEYVLGAHDAVAGVAHARRVVVVLEQADLEALVEAHRPAR